MSAFQCKRKRWWMLFLRSKNGDTIYLGNNFEFSRIIKHFVISCIKDLPHLCINAGFWSSWGSILCYNTALASKMEWWIPFLVNISCYPLWACPSHCSLPWKISKTLISRNHPLLPSYRLTKPIPPRPIKATLHIGMHYSTRVSSLLPYPQLASQDT